MVVKNLEALVLRGVTVVLGGKTGVTGIGSFAALERTPACLSDQRLLSRLFPQAYPPAPPAAIPAYPAADDRDVRGAGRPRGRFLRRGTASSAGRPVPFGQSPSAGEGRVLWAKTPMQAASFRGCLPVSHLLKGQHGPSHRCCAIPSGDRGNTGPARMWPATGAFTASLRGKSAG